MKYLVLFFVLIQSVSAARRAAPVKITNHGALTLESREYPIDMSQCLADPNVRIDSNSSSADRDSITCSYKVAATVYDSGIVQAPWDNNLPFTQISKEIEDISAYVNIFANSWVNPSDSSSYLKYTINVHFSVPRGSISTPEGVALAAAKLKSAIPFIGLRVMRAQIPVYK